MTATGTAEKTRQGNHLDAMALRGTQLLQANDFAAAADLLSRVVAARPDWSPILANLGNALTGLCRLDEAEAVLRRAVAAAPEAHGPRANLGMALKLQGRFEEAIEAYRAAIERAPDHAPYALNLSLLLMLTGAREEGLALYPARWRTPAFAGTQRPVHFPIWQGERLAGKRILVTVEQGMGDLVMGAGLVLDLVAMGASVILEMPARLVLPMRRSLKGVIVVEARDALPRWLLETRVDYQIELLSLLHHLRPAAADWRPLPAYLSAPPQLTAELRARYRSIAGERPLIGISWSSGSSISGHHRSIPLDEWAPILRLPGAAFVNLQYGAAAADSEAVAQRLGITLITDGQIDQTGEMTAPLAQIAAMDHVISVDNSTVHMAGALGRPTWTLLPAVPDWRWGIAAEPGADREPCPIYRSNTLWRQATMGDWAPVIRRVAETLPHALTDRHSPAITPTVTTGPATNAPRLAFVNDTTNWYHFGCTATSGALRLMAEAFGAHVDSVPIQSVYALAEVPQTLDGFDDTAAFARFAAANPQVVDRLSAADAVMVNGEGTLHGRRAHVIGLLYLMYAAERHLGRPVFLVNHGCFPSEDDGDGDPLAMELYARVYQALTHVAVRDHRSYGVLARMGVEATLAFDCLPLWIAEHIEPMPVPASGETLIAGSAISGAVQIGEIAGFMRAEADAGRKVTIMTGALGFPAADDRLFLERLRKDGWHDDWQHWDAPSLDAWLDRIHRADVLVSGRFHHSVAAASFGTPFVVMGSVTPKVQALTEMLEMGPPLDPALPDLATRLAEAADAARAARLPHDKVVTRLEALARMGLENASALGPWLADRAPRA